MLLLKIFRFIFQFISAQTAEWNSMNLSYILFTWRHRAPLLFWFANKMSFGGSLYGFCGVVLEYHLERFTHIFCSLHSIAALLI